MPDMPQWLAAVSRELDLPEDLAPAVCGPLLDMVRDIAHGVNRPSGPMSAYLVGVLAGAAAARAGQSVVDAEVAVGTTTTAVDRVRAMVAAHQQERSHPAEG